MKKLITGAIAGTIGIALLLGGAGTFALWTSTATVSAPSINSGTLTLAAANDGVWKDGTTTITPSSYKLIPGKTVTYTQTLNITATGDGLKADLTASALTGSSVTTGTTTSSDLAAAVTKSLAVTVSSGNATVSGTTVSVNGPGAVVVVATITVALPSTVTTTTGQNSTLTLGDETFTLTQKLS